MAEVFAVVATSIALFQQTIEFAKTVNDLLDSFKGFDSHVEVLRLKYSTEYRRLVAAKTVLFENVGLGFDGDGTLFEHISTDGKLDVRNMIEQLQALLFRLNVISQKYSGSQSSQLSSLQVGERPSSEPMLAKSSSDEDRSGGRSFTSKLKWALRDRARAEGIVREIGEWNSRMKEDILTYFLPTSAFSNPGQLVRLKDSTDLRDLGIAGDIELRRLLLDTAAAADYVFDRSKLRHIPGAKHRHATLITRGPLAQRTAIVEYKIQDRLQTPEDMDKTELRVNQLAKMLLQASKIHMRILPCQGYFVDEVSSVRDADHVQYGIVFLVPATVDPQPLSISHLLNSGSGFAKPHLGTRMTLASALSSSLLKLHLLGWIHKSLSSENVLFFKARSNESLATQSSTAVVTLSHASRSASNDTIGLDISTPYLFGFDYSRPVSDVSSLRGLQLQMDATSNAIPLAAYYVHPDRWKSPPDEFRPIHDLYSLGVILLEIGLWQNVESLCEGVGGEADQLLLSKSVQTRLIKHAQRRLGFYVGKKYEEAVLKCLGGLEWGIADKESSDPEVRLLKACREELIDVLAGLTDS